MHTGANCQLNWPEKNTHLGQNESMNGIDFPGVLRCQRDRCTYAHMHFLLVKMDPIANNAYMHMVSSQECGSLGYFFWLSLYSACLAHFKSAGSNVSSESTVSSELIIFKGLADTSTAFLLTHALNTLRSVFLSSKSNCTTENRTMGIYIQCMSTYCFFFFHSFTDVKSDKWASSRENLSSGFATS